MKKITDIKNLLSLEETLSATELVEVKGGLRRDDKRRQRPGGGTTTTTLSKTRYTRYFEL